MMKSISFGWEATNLLNNGADSYVEVVNPIVLNALQGNVAIAFPSARMGYFGTNTESGFAEVLAQGFIASAKPNFAGGNAEYFNGPVAGNADFANASGLSAPGVSTVAGAAPISGGLFASILKTNAPDAAFVPISVSGLSLVIPAGSWIVFHADHAGVGPVDFELQLTMFYSA